MLPSAGRVQVSRVRGQLEDMSWDTSDACWITPPGEAILSLPVSITIK